MSWKGVHMSVIQCSLCEKTYKGLTTTATAQITTHFKLRHKGKKFIEHISMSSVIGNKHDIANMITGAEIKDGSVVINGTGLSRMTGSGRKDASGHLTDASTELPEGKRELKLTKPTVP